MRVASAVACAVAAALALSSCRPSPPLEDGELPASWTGRKNPLPDDASTRERGRRLFEASCAVCHGVGADGRGPASRGLDPPPADLHDGGRLARHGDAFLFWRISVGRSGTAMPAFEGSLTEEERWAILRYLRSLGGT